MARRTSAPWRQWEMDLAQVARAAGWLMIAPPPDVKILRRDKVNPSIFTGRFEGKLWTDLFGISPGGLPVAVEAKLSSSTPSWRLDDRLQGHQGRILSDVARRGGAAVACVRGPMGDYVVPWGPDGAPFEGKSIRWQAMAPWRLAPGEPWIARAEVSADGRALLEVVRQVAHEADPQTIAVALDYLQGHAAGQRRIITPHRSRVHGWLCLLVGVSQRALFEDPPAFDTFKDTIENIADAVGVKLQYDDEGRLVPPEPLAQGDC